MLRQFEFTDGFEMMHNALYSIEEVPYCFWRSSIKFQGYMGKKMDDLNPILSKITSPTAAIKSLRLALLVMICQQTDKILICVNENLTTMSQYCITVMLQITGHFTLCSTALSGQQQSKHQIYHHRSFVSGIQGLWQIPLTKGQ